MSLHRRTRLTNETRRQIDDSKRRAHYSAGLAVFLPTEKRQEKPSERRFVSDTRGWYILDNSISYFANIAMITQVLRHKHNTKKLKRNSQCNNL